MSPWAATKYSLYRYLYILLIHDLFRCLVSIRLILSTIKGHWSIIKRGHTWLLFCLHVNDIRDINNLAFGHLSVAIWFTRSEIVYCTLSIGLEVCSIHSKKDFVIWREYIYVFRCGLHGMKISYDDTRLRVLLSWPIKDRWFCEVVELVNDTLPAVRLLREISCNLPNRPESFLRNKLSIKCSYLLNFSLKYYVLPVLVVA